MVGVPHSTGCSLCRERRIKCDEAVPQCTQCRKYGRPCPGYRRTFRFQDEGPALQRRHQSSARRTSTSISTEATFPEAAAVAVVRDNAIAMIQRTQTQTQTQSTDTDIPTTHHQPHLFATFIQTAFPTLYTSNRFRATDRPDFLTHLVQNYGRCAYLDTTICCLSSVYLAHRTGDATELRAGRQMYAAALSGVVRALRSPHALSDSMLATVMMLSVYEMYAQTSQDAWAVHVDGVQRMMLARGPGPHESAFGRSCYIAFRGFLVAAAVYERRPCLLDGREWLRLAARIRGEDAGKHECAALVDVQEAIAIELVKCPRYLAEAQSQTRDSPDVDVSLLLRVRQTHGRLVLLVRELASIASGRDSESAPRLLLQGAECTIAALEYLMRWLGDGGSVPFRVVSEFHRGVSASDQDVTWLDRVASSMGMLGLEIIPSVP